jgi:hypothetical protein
MYAFGLNPRASAFSSEEKRKMAVKYEPLFAFHYKICLPDMINVAEAPSVRKEEFAAVCVP